MWLRNIITTLYEEENMKRKNYKITIKIKYETTMLHSGTSANKAIEDVVKVWTDILRQDRTLKNLFELPPHIVHFQ